MNGPRRSTKPAAHHPHGDDDGGDGGDDSGGDGVGDQLDNTSHE